MKENTKILIEKYTKGVLKKELLKRIWWINSVSVIPLWIIILIAGLSSTNVNSSKITLNLIIFYHISSILFIKYVDVTKYNKINFIKHIIIFIMRIPVYITQYFSIMIFKLLLIDKYPEMTQDNFLRYTKLKKLKQNISKHKFYVYEKR